MTELGPMMNLLSAIGLAFALSLLVAFVYVRVNREGPLQHTFVQSLAVAGVVASLVVLSIGDNVARGIGLVGALTVIRFRSTLRDSRDLIFAFGALASGVAVGAHAYAAAVLGTLVFLGGTMLAARLFTSDAAFDAILSLRTQGNVEGLEAISRVLDRYTSTHALVRVRQLGEGEQEHSYQVTLSKPQHRAALVRDVEAAGARQALLVAYAPAVEA
jgi:uncharacterized membrane protein YhiD involved in acid resistance